MILVRASSHRAYQRLFQLFPKARELPSFYLDLFHDKSKGYYQIPDELLVDALKIPGITKARNQNFDDYGMHWK
jgi:hypothetical protein